MSCLSTWKSWNWGGIAVFEYDNKNSFLQHYTCWIYLDLDLNLVYFIMQNHPVTREWTQADWLDPLLSILFVFFVTKISDDQMLLVYNLVNDMNSH